MAIIDIPIFLIGFGLGCWVMWRERAALAALIPQGEDLAKKLEADAAALQVKATADIAALQAKAAAVRAAIKPAA